MSPTNYNELIDFISNSNRLKTIKEKVKLESTKSSQKDSSHDYFHLLRVALMSLRFSETSQSKTPVKLDLEVLIAAALMHDVINVPKNSPDRKKASTLCAAWAKPLLEELEFSKEQVKLICEAIEDHSFSRGATPRSFLGECLQDADRLESIGAIGLMRVFATGSLLQSDFFNPEDPWATNRELNDLKFMIDHFFNKLLKIPKLMNTEGGKAEAKIRADRMIRFLKDLGKEINHPLPKDKEIYEI